MTNEIDVSRFKKVPLDEIVNPQKSGPLWPMKDRWWAVTEDGCVLIYTHRGANSPQCNVNRAIVERMTYEGLATTPKFLPWAYHQFSLKEYA